MPDNVASDWALPVNFYFLVEFQSKLDHFQASFTEVSGLDIQLRTKNHSNDTGMWIKMPETVTYGNITLKRPVVPLKGDFFTQWVNKCLKADKDKQMIPYDVIVKLMDKEGKPLIGWKCAYTYPVQWTSGGRDSNKSELATETVVLTCNRMERII